MKKDTRVRVQNKEIKKLKTTQFVLSAGQEVKQTKTPKHKQTPRKFINFKVLDKEAIKQQ